MKIVSRKEAKVAGLKRYFTGKPCRNGHVAERYVCHSVCVLCSSARCAAHYRKNPDKIRAQSAAWQRDNPDKAREHKNSWARANPDKTGAWKRANPDKERARKAAWQRANPDNMRVRVARRRSKKLLRTPAWADHDKIAKVYLLAAFAIELTGVPHHVDHEIPLQSKLVSGLHVHTNLRVVPSTENARKSNKFAPYVEFFASPDEVAVALIPC